MTIWEEEALKHLPLLIDGGNPPRYAVVYGGIDAFNAQMLAKKRGLSLSQARNELDATHHRLVNYIERAPEEQSVRETRFRRRLKLDTCGHYLIHARMIQQWHVEPAGQRDRA